MVNVIDKPGHVTNETNNKTPFPKRYAAAAILGRVVGTRLRRGKETRIADRTMANLSKLESLPDEETAKIKEVVHDTRYWHGTGRFQIKEGEKVDILEFVAKGGKLEPQYDDLDFTGPMQSLSTARSRMYARVYADVHGKGSAEKSRHGSAAFWATVFMGDIAVETALETKVWLKSNRAAARAHFRNSERASGWSAKVNGAFTSADQLFLSGSRIPGNYPILFGIKEGAFEPAQTSRSIAIHETRAQEPLSLDKDISHIEVPAERVIETVQMLREFGHVVPVLPIEDVERYVSNIPFSQLVAGNLV